MVESVVFIAKTGYPSTIYHIKVNPSYQDISKMEEICEAIGENDYKLIYLSKEEIGKLKVFA